MVMTQEKAFKIAKKHIGDNSKTISCFEAIKEAVNDALDEVKNKGKAVVRTNGEWTSSNVTAFINEESINKLKI